MYMNFNVGTWYLPIFAILLFFAILLQDRYIVVPMILVSIHVIEFKETVCDCYRSAVRQIIKMFVC